MIDIAGYVFDRLTRTHPDAYVGPELASPAQYPTIYYSIAGPGATTPGLIWRTTLDLDIWDDATAARALAAAAYDDIHSWEGSVTDGLWVVSVTDSALMTLATRSTYGQRNIAHWTGGFDLLCRTTKS